MREGWHEVAIDSVLEVSIGGIWGSEPGGEEEDVLVLRSTEFGADGRLEPSTAVRRSVSTKQLASRRLQRNDILLEKSGGGPNQPVGRVGLVTELAGPSVCSNFVQLLRPNPHLVDPVYLWYALWYQHSVGLTLGYQSQTTGIRNLRAKDYLAAPIVLPPLDEQRRIVDLITAVDAVIEAIAQVVKCSAALEASLAATAFSWESGTPRPLRDFCESNGIQIGPFGSQLHKSDYVPSGIPSIMPKDLTAGTIDEVSVARISEEKAASLARHRLLEGDVLLPRRGDLTKRAQVQPGQVGWLCGTGTVRVRPRKDVDARALYRALSTAEVNQWLSDRAVGATMPNLNTSIVEQIPVQLPLDASAAVDAIEAAERNRRDGERLNLALAVVRSALLTDLLSGEHEIPSSYDALLAS